jgi:hypothetical protein
MAMSRADSTRASGGFRGVGACQSMRYMVLYENRESRRSRTVGEPIVGRVRALFRATI